MGENVDDATVDDNFAYMQQALFNIGYVMKHKSLASVDYGGKTKRHRAFFVMIEYAKCQMTVTEASKWIDGVFQLCERMVIRNTKGYNIDVDEFLLADDDPYLQALLDTALNKRVGDTAGTPSNGSSSTSAPWWPQKYVEMLSDEGLTVGDVQAPAETLDSPWYDLLPERERVVLGYGIRRHGEHTFAIDTTQGLNRFPVSVTKVFPTVTPSGRVWCVPRRLPVAGFEALALHGWPKSILNRARSYADSLLKDLAGNSFDCHVVMPLLLAILVNLPEEKPSSEEADEDLIDFVAGLKPCSRVGGRRARNSKNESQLKRVIQY